MARRSWTSDTYEIFRFGLKQGWACLFGGIAVVLMIATWRYYPAQSPLPRYDFLFLCMISVQASLLALRMETWAEAKVILIYHGVGTLMEIFKTAVGSWIYPEASMFRIAGVPLFTGFMYFCIGSYICRAWRLFGFRFSHHPPRGSLVALSLAIYAFLHRPFRPGFSPAAVRRRRGSVVPHHYPFQDLAWLSRDAAAARLAARRVLHLAVGKYRHGDENLALSVTASRLVDGLAGKTRFVVSARDRQLHPGQPGQCAAGPGGGRCACTDRLDREASRGLRASMAALVLPSGLESLERGAGTSS
jgi:hypothetical protein